MATGGSATVTAPTMTTGNPDREHVCPLCGTTTATRNEVYVHLQLNHRKSSICDALVAATEPGEARLLAGN